jgi:ParB family chromosome partitioning protein
MTRNHTRRQAKKRGLGRGLEALLGPKAAAEKCRRLQPKPSARTAHLAGRCEYAAGKYQPRRSWTTKLLRNWPSRSRRRA